MRFWVVILNIFWLSPTGCEGAFLIQGENVDSYSEI